MNKISIRFDGGCRPTNPGNKYGSFEVGLNGQQIILVSRQEFGRGTNNEAEFDAFEAALKWTICDLKKSGNVPHKFHLIAYTDSMVVLKRMNRSVRTGKKESQHRMALCCAKCLNYTKLFLTFEIYWNGRKYNVEKFGH